MSDTPRVDALDFGDQTIFKNGNGYGQLWELARQLERELRQEQEQSMMAGSQNSALRLQLRDKPPEDASASFWPIGFINNDGGITFEVGREPRPEQGGKLIYIARSTPRSDAALHSDSPTKEK